MIRFATARAAARLMPLVCLLAACGGEAFSPTPDDVFGQWSLRDHGVSRTYLNEPITCRVSFDVEITSDTTSKFVYPDAYVTAYYANTGSDGMLRCAGDGQTHDEPFLRDRFLLVVIDGTSIEFWHPNSRLLYAGEITGPSRMEGRIPADYWNRDGAWFALRR